MKHIFFEHLRYGYVFNSSNKYQSTFRNFDFQRRQGHVTETVEMGYFVNALRIAELFVIFRT